MEVSTSMNSIDPEYETFGLINLVVLWTTDPRYLQESKGRPV